MKYEDIKKSKAYLNDKGCCTVVASAIAFNVPFERMQEVFKVAIGRRKNSGVRFTYFVDKLAKTYGYKVESFQSCNNFGTLSNNIKKVTKSALTVATAEKALTSGNYILSMSGHVASLKNGIVEDWSRGSKRRIKKIYKFTKIKKSKVVKKSKFDKYIIS
tara:strand:- start:910 stop:1389 length:480 start_codon:yes stop_codon:yes gene_type:complete